MFSVLDAFKTFRRFQCSVNFDEFCVIFGEQGAHLWDKFTKQCDSNLLEFFFFLDGKNGDALCDYISNKYENEVNPGLIDFAFRTEARISNKVIAHDLENLASDNSVGLSQIKNILSALFSVQFHRLNRD